MYADDIILFSISVTDLQLMFNLRANVLADLDLPINVPKCHCLRIRSRFNTACSTITVQGVSIQWLNKIKFLGITICNQNPLSVNGTILRLNSIEVLM